MYFIFVDLPLVLIMGLKSLSKALSLSTYITLHAMYYCLMSLSHYYYTVGIPIYIYMSLHIVNFVAYFQSDNFQSIFCEFSIALSMLSSCLIFNDYLWFYFYATSEDIIFCYYYNHSPFTTELSSWKQKKKEEIEKSVYLFICCYISFQFLCCFYCHI